MEENEKVWSYEYEKDKELKPGQLLLSEPFMFDENFRRTVVLICEHDEENGTVGLVLNRPVNLRMQDVMDDFPTFKTTLHLGGPVGTDTLQFVHTKGDEIENSLPLVEGLYWGGDFEQIKDMVALGTMGADEIKFFLGYSGWGVGQLLEELKANSWIIAPAQAAYLFHADLNTLWKRIMINMGGLYNTMANYPENPILN